MVPFADALETLRLLGLSLLTVAGGAVAGALLTALVVWLTCRVFARQQPPLLVRKVLRWLGAIAGALFVAGYLHLGGGSGWLFGGGGLGPGLGGAKSAGDEELAKNKDATLSKAEEARPKGDGEPRSDRVRVAVLGGDLVTLPNYYRIEGQPRAVDLKGVREHVQRLRQADPKLTGVDILIYKNSLYSNSEPVKQLKAQVAELGLTPNIVELSGDLPPNG